MLDNDGRPLAPRLPDAGWLPDPASYDIERYWDGQRWTQRTRDRATGIEMGAPPLTLNPVPYLPATRDAEHLTAALRKRRARVGAVRALVILVAVLAFALPRLGNAGLLPDGMPFARTPATAMVATNPPAKLPGGYTVFGSDDDVKGLAEHMIAHDQYVDVTDIAGADGDMQAVDDAMREAQAQNPYVFASGYGVVPSPEGTIIAPNYTYDAAESERRRAAVKAALALAVSNSGALEAVGDRAKARKVHDFVVANATYDYAAYERDQRGRHGARHAGHRAVAEAYGIVVDGTAVCNGYAQAYVLLANAVGLDAVLVTGDVSEGVTTGLHAWNKVRVDGTWLVVDPTWDDDDRPHHQHHLLPARRRRAAARHPHAGPRLGRRRERGGVRGLGRARGCCLVHTGWCTPPAIDRFSAPRG